jgi:hypothetical protein
VEVNSATEVHDELKNRKMSADYILLQEWIKSSEKVKDMNFAGSSFSTRVTFSSRGDFEAIIDPE